MRIQSTQDLQQKSIERLAVWQVGILRAGVGYLRDFHSRNSGLLIGQILSHAKADEYHP
jgi:hypothetical protein